MLSERLGVTEDQINEMDQRLASTDLSLNVQVGEDSGGASRMDFLPALGPGIEDTLASDEIAGLVRSRLKTIMPKLNEKEVYILQNRLLTDEPVTLREIGERYNVTRERVRQLEARLLEKSANTSPWTSRTFQTHGYNHKRRCPPDNRTAARRAKCFALTHHMEALLLVGACFQKYRRGCGFFNRTALNYNET